MTAPRKAAESSQENSAPEEARRPEHSEEEAVVAQEEFAAADGDLLLEHDAETKTDGDVPSEQVEVDLAESATKAAEYLALAQRTQADFENFRKRMTRDAGLAEKRGVERLAKGILPALDHFEVALRGAAIDDGTSPEVVKGFELIHHEFIAALERVGIERFSPQGEPFDPNEHEAMAQQPSDEVESGTVIEVFQHGYRLNGSVLRAARVVVAS